MTLKMHRKEKRKKNLNEYRRFLGERKKVKEMWHILFEKNKSAFHNSFFFRESARSAAYTIWILSHYYGNTQKKREIVFGAPFFPRKKRDPLQKGVSNKSSFLFFIEKCSIFLWLIGYSKHYCDARFEMSIVFSTFLKVNQVTWRSKFLLIVKDRKRIKTSCFLSQV